MKKFRVSQPRRYTAAFTLALVALLLAFTLAYAAHTTINTDDNTVDPNWAIAGLLRADPTGDTIGGPFPNYDLTAVYVANDAPVPTEFYFRADVVGVEEPPTEFLVVIDCNNNGNPNEAVDVRVVAWADSAGSGGTVFVTQGDGSGGPDIYGAEFVEAIGAGPTTFEWRAPTSGAIDWSACSGPIGLRFESWNPGTRDRAPDSGLAGYNVPTTVELQGFDAGTDNEPSPVLWLVGAAALLALGGLVVFMRRRSTT